MKAIFEEVDTRNERFSLYAIPIEVIRVTVGCGDKYDTVRHQSFEETDNVSFTSTSVTSLTYRLRIIASATSVH